MSESLTGSAAAIALFPAREAQEERGSLSSASVPPAAAPSLPPRMGGLAAMVELHLHSYFAAHEKGRLPSAGLYERVIREVERPLLTLSLAACNGNQLKAAALLGLNRNTLRKKIRELGLPPARRRRGQGSGA